jgi:hypothetical protein
MEAQDALRRTNGDTDTMAFDSQTDPSFPGFQFPMPRTKSDVAPKPASKKRTKKRTKKAKRTVNFASENRPKTERMHRVIAEILKQHDGMTLSELGRSMGMSRQLMRYHVLKMVAHKRVLVILEPCEGNGGVQYRVYEKAQHAQQAVKWLHEHAGVAA